MTNPSRWAAALVALGATALSAQAQRCEATSGPQQALLVELYTSEGCNSCPPADRWLSMLKSRPEVLAAAFHVDYWDRLGWKDRFGSARFTERQAEQQASSGAGFSYTPQVLVNGRDWRRWPALPAMAAAAAIVQIHLLRDNDQRVSVQVTPQPGAPARLAAWWALLEDGHVSAVKAGENSGVTLQHDHVVRAYGRQPAWAAAARHWPLDVPRRGEGGRATRLLLVVTDGRSGAPLQAVQLGC
ncbi:DUF1223 domain-containing protein [Aquabacterium sp.]|uniref:DUF1223 domain-containing protein n=1 Tax=Aquabacterium sp. TaxID=1872578 RepID=UPI002C4AA99C|nr:DUF1223 domain-containing protein [Aquabacterium sp.]HSW03711.1 DUF1223 domain-containing protein [Aquabacterium sp.]